MLDNRQHGSRTVENLPRLLGPAKKMLLFLAVETSVAGVKRYFLLIFRDCWLSLLLQISLEIILEEADYY